MRRFRPGEWSASPVCRARHLISLEEPLIVPPHSDVTILLDRGALTTAYPTLETSGGRDASIDLTYAEALYDADHKKGNRNETAGRHIEGVRDQIAGDGGKRTYRTLWWRTWRYLQVEVRTAETALTIERLGGFYTAYPFRLPGTLRATTPSSRGYGKPDGSPRSYAPMKPIWILRIGSNCNTLAIPAFRR